MYYLNIFKQKSQRKSLPEWINLKVFASLNFQNRTERYNFPKLAQLCSAVLLHLNFCNILMLCNPGKGLHLRALKQYRYSYKFIEVYTTCCIDLEYRPKTENTCMAKKRVNQIIWIAVGHFNAVGYLKLNQIIDQKLTQNITKKLTQNIEIECYISSRYMLCHKNKICCIMWRVWKNRQNCQ